MLTVFNLILRPPVENTQYDPLLEELDVALPETILTDLEDSLLVALQSRNPMFSLNFVPDGMMSSAKWKQTVLPA